MSQNQAKAKLKAIPQYDDSHYAVVDLGSNSFHLLITQVIDSPSGKSIKIVNKVKQKIRLAAGLNDDNFLTDEAMTRGLNCLKKFALYLHTIPTTNILIVATAALRIAKNNQLFFNAANAILPKKVKLLSGEQEAQTIYAGAVHTAKATNQLPIKTKQLVLDIGGASTEMIVGIDCSAKKVVSLDMGCVSLIAQYFAEGLLTKENFNQGISHATKLIETVKAEFIALGWQSATGSSGTMQAIIEILNYRQQPEIITLAFLYDIKEQLINCKTIAAIDITGLRTDRKAVLAGGLCILIALFECLAIKELRLSSGALREGLLFELAPDAKII